nr:hypothetical protein Hi04_10k_c5016_00014 [uncultured bacterium]
MANGVSAVFRSVLAAGGFDKNAAHGLRRSSEKVSAVVPLIVILPTDQSQVCLMHQGGGLQGVSGGFGGHADGGKLAKFVIDNRQQLRCRMAVATLSCFEKSGDLGHDHRFYQRFGTADNVETGDDSGCRKMSLEKVRCATRWSFNLPDLRAEIRIFATF